MSFTSLKKSTHFHKFQAVLNLGLIESQGFGESVLRVQQRSTHHVWVSVTSCSVLAVKAAADHT